VLRGSRDPEAEAALAALPAKDGQLMPEHQAEPSF